MGLLFMKEKVISKSIAKSRNLFLLSVGIISLVQLGFILLLYALSTSILVCFQPVLTNTYIDH